MTSTSKKKGPAEAATSPDHGFNLPPGKSNMDTNITKARCVTIPVEAVDDLGLAIAVLNTLFLALGNRDGFDGNDPEHMRRTLVSALRLIGNTYDAISVKAVPA